MPETAVTGNGKRKGILRMKEIILVKNGELALKGLNRSSFESALMRQIRRSL